MLQMSSMPKIGITTSYENGRQMLDLSYVRAVEAAGAVPVIVPMFNSKQAAAEFSSLLDGLVITGGPGITQGLIGTLPEDLPAVDPVRDASDRLIYEQFSERPILGICYGMQFINAQAGGTIYADVVHQRHSSLLHSASRGGQPHSLMIEQDSHLRKIFGFDELVVNTHHIQAVAEPGQGFRVAGYGPDGVIEAIETLDGRMIGVQFHPERMLEQTKPLFEDFVTRCRKA